MPLIDMTVAHGRTLDDARGRLAMAVAEASKVFGPMVRRVEWSADRSSAKLVGLGFWAELRVDGQSIYAQADLPLLGGLLGKTGEAGLKQVVQRAFPAPGASSTTPPK